MLIRKDRCVEEVISQIKDTYLFTSCQINETHFGNLDLGGETCILVLQLDEDLEDSVRSAALLVGVRGVLGSISITYQETIS